jgi:hypothetical protein
MKKAHELLEIKPYNFNYIKPNDSVLDALDLMSRRDIDFAIVSENDKYFGIITENSCAKQFIAYGELAKNIKTKEIMLNGLPIVNYDDSIETCLNTLIIHNVVYLPVFDNFSFCGIITMHDLIKEIQNDNMQGVIEAEYTYA